VFERGTIGATIVRSEERPAARPVRESSRWAQPEGPQGATPDARRTRRTSARTPGPRRSTLHRDVYYFQTTNIRRRWFVTSGIRQRHRSALGSTSYRYRAESRSRKEEWSQPRARALPFAGSRGLRIAPTPTHGARQAAGPVAVRGTGDRGSTRGIRAITAGGGGPARSSPSGPSRRAARGAAGYGTPAARCRSGPDRSRVVTRTIYYYYYTTTM
jgi:hypothetical protein